ncbi:hypothetical protein Mp_6g04330 [Marchantia polymorpha subsp. ruderalis]|uniref:Uncharacterized protein n=2 Tax=Marchantia polymorpha TaxID=3197 RepID=A0AAF6BNF4_MARPO|nr:hypothetical protein MARPO_0034s0082 [Marchantia polymorpha]PTQ41501.1 hypothetical protein MARPO_0034s0086 [Marchantia polymorpha]PTQ41504.1 hypothetical protein MARPO_0034s0089 [Marchantia polymorpha]BBN13538.1 hypothetical protein Mp_6g04330 [Marchantia polymorpha subsp. ruderalis]|eukprot:PTQ41497.1 hypothetical protein MARPO_0034s0082 [Marchantia polymorpha]
MDLSIFGLKHAALTVRTFALITEHILDSPSTFGARKYQKCSHCLHSFACSCHITSMQLSRGVTRAQVPTEKSQFPISYPISEVLFSPEVLSKCTSSFRSFLP